LATILSSAELLRFYGDRIVGAERLEIIQSIESSVHRMTSMLDRILVLGKAEAQMLEFNPQPLDVIAILGGLVQEAGDQAPQRSCHLKTDFPPDLGLAMLDDKLLRHIFGNLLSNAIKYSPNGGTVRLALRPDEAHMEFVVSDQGIGIPVAEQAHLFSSFHRASNVGDIKGTGLGLAIVKNAVEMHGGTIAVNSEPGAGTTLTIRLPFQRVSPG
jgi:signal transduction histidine kinase